jgi:uncharacterized protein
MKAARAILLALLLGWVFPTLTSSLAPALANVAVPPLVGRVVDQTGTLSASSAEELQQSIRAFEARKGSQIAVLIVPSTDGEAIEQFSLRVAEAWKIGRKKIDDGVLLVVAKNDRHLRIEVGYGLEGALTDVTAKRIIDEIITPRFRNSDFTGGISAGVDRIIRIIEGEKLPAPPPRRNEPQQQASNLLNHVDPVFALFVLFGFGAVMRNLLGALLGATITGGIVGALAWYLSGSFAAALLATFMVFMMALVAEILAAANQGSPKGRRGRSGWGDSSSSSGSSWSSGSSSSSSDSSSSSSDSGGGGGSFGGGGASGSW